MSNFLEDIERFKGPPVFDLAERVKMVQSIKWVDEVFFTFVLFPVFLSTAYLFSHLFINHLTCCIYRWDIKYDNSLF